MTSFKRKVNPIDKKYLDKMYSKKIDSFSFPFMRKMIIKKIFRDEDTKLVQVYLHNIYSEWLVREYDTSLRFFGKMKKMIRKLSLELDEIEKQELQLYEERAFSIQRHIKILLVDMDLRNGEEAGAKFTRVSFFKKTTLLRKIDYGDAIFTNKRIIIKAKEYYEFNWKDIKNIEFQHYGFEFKYNNITYVIRIHDQQSLNNTLMNFIEKKVK